MALYGIGLEQTELVPLARDIIAMLRAADQEPSHLTAVARGFGNRPLLFDRAWKRMQKAQPDDVQAVHLYTLVEDWDSLSDWTATFAIDREGSYILLSAGLLGMLDAEFRFLDLLRSSLDRIRPIYGIGFVQRRDQGPDFYTVGVSFGTDEGATVGPEYEEDVATGRWADGMDEAVYEQGILRDVYPYSLLTARHLRRDIDGRPLWAWIQEKPQRGQLAPFGDGGDYTLWTVGPENLASTRRQLAAAGGLYVLDRENHL